MSPITISQETEILSRVISPENPCFSAEAARSILALGFGDKDNERMNVLAAKAQQGDLDEQEKSLLNAYMFVGLSLIHI